MKRMSQSPPHVVDTCLVLRTSNSAKDYGRCLIKVLDERVGPLSEHYCKEDLGSEIDKKNPTRTFNMGRSIQVHACQMPPAPHPIIIYMRLTPLRTSEKLPRPQKES